MKTETCKLYSRDFWIFLPVMSTKLIVIISSYTVSKLVHFLRQSVVVAAEMRRTWRLTGVFMYTMLNNTTISDFYVIFWPLVTVVEISQNETNYCQSAIWPVVLYSTTRTRTAGRGSATHSIGDVDLIYPGVVRRHITTSAVWTQERPRQYHGIRQVDWQTTATQHTTLTQSNKPANVSVRANDDQWRHLYK